MINKPFPWKGWLRQNAIAIAWMVLLRFVDVPWPLIGAYFLLVVVPMNVLVIFQAARGRGDDVFASKSTPRWRALIFSYSIMVVVVPFLVYYYYWGMPLERMILILILAAVAWGVVFALRSYVRRNRTPGKRNKDLPDVM